MPKPRKTNPSTKPQTAQDAFDDFRNDLIALTGAWTKLANTLETEQPANMLLFGLAEGLRAASHDLLTLTIK